MKSFVKEAKNSLKTAKIISNLKTKRGICITKRPNIAMMAVQAVGLWAAKLEIVRQVAALPVALVSPEVPETEMLLLPVRQILQIVKKLVKTRRDKTSMPN